jgi:hypothetical protein
MPNIFSYAKDIPVLLKTYISPQILEDIYQFLVIKGKRITKTFPVEIHITEHCNLNCKGCNHFSSLAREEYLEPDAFEKDLKRLAELSKGFFAIKILGGEPLLHPRLTDFLEIARTYFPSTPIQLTTNGVLLLKQPEEFWSICNKNKIIISISQYPIKLNKNEIKKTAKIHKVKLVFNGTSAENRMCKMPLDPTGSQDCKTSFQKCVISWGCCVTLRGGRLYTCCIAAHIRFFNEYFNQNLLICEKDYVDIYAIKNKNEIIDFLEKPFPFCRYCNTKETKLGQSWGISKKEITEWID